MLGYTSTVIKEVPAGGENESRCYAKQEYPNSRTKKKQKLAQYRITKNLSYFTSSPLKKVFLC